MRGSVPVIFICVVKTIPSTEVQGDYHKGYGTINKDRG